MVIYIGLEKNIFKYIFKCLLEALKIVILLQNKHLNNEKIKIKNNNSNLIKKSLATILESINSSSHTTTQ